MFETTIVMHNWKSHVGVCVGRQTDGRHADHNGFAFTEPIKIVEHFHLRSQDLHDIRQLPAVPKIYQHALTMNLALQNNIYLTFQ